MFEIQRVVRIRPSRVFRLSLASVMFAGMFLCGGTARAQDASLIERWESATPMHVAVDQSATLDPAVTSLDLDLATFASLKDQGHVAIRNFPINESETVDLVLEQYHPYVPNLISQSLETDASGRNVVIERPVEIKTLFFRGTVVGEADSMVVLNLMPGMCSGMIEIADTRHHITTDPSTGLTSISDPLADQPGLQTLRKMMRDVEKQAGEQPPYRGGAGVPAGCAEIRLWIAYGADYLALFANSGAAENYAAQVTALVSAIMVRDGMTYVGLTLGGFTGPGTTPLWGNGTLAADLCAATNVIFGSTVFGVPPLIATPPAADACMILRTGAAGASTFGLATKQSAAWFGGLTTGVNPNAACPPGTPSYFGACSGLVGDGGQYDQYIFAQALGTLCGAGPTGQTATIDISATAVPLAFDACDTGACSQASPGTIMSSCEPTVGICTDPTAFGLRFNSLNATAMNAFLTGVAGALIAPGGLTPAPIQGVAATVGGAGNCAQVVITWTPDVNSTTTYVWRNSVNEFDTDPPLSPLVTLTHAAGGDPGTHTDAVATGGVIYYYWVTAENDCGTNIIADQYNPQIISQNTNPPTPGQGAQGMIGSGQAEIPGVVAGVFATGTCGQCIVTWNLTNPPYPGAGTGSGTSATQRYRIWRGVVDNFDDLGTASIGTTAAVGAGPGISTFTDTDAVLADGDVFYYWVTAEDTACGPLPPVSPAVGNAAAGATQPSIAGTLMRPGASDGVQCDTVEISWVMPPWINSYTIFRETAVPGIVPIFANAVVLSQTYSAWDANGEPVTSYFDDTVEPGVTYNYWVRATNNCGATTFPPPDADAVIGFSENVGRPVGVSVTEPDPGVNTIACGDLMLGWTASERADGYAIYRSPTNLFSGATQIEDKQEDNTYTDTPPIPGEIYFYWIVALDGDCGESDPSSAVFGTTLPPVEIPTTLVATKATFCDRIQVTWEGAFDGDTTYNIYRSLTGDFTDEILIGVSDSIGAYEDPQDNTGGLNPALQGIDYHYRVRATGVAGTCHNGAETDPSGSDVGRMANALVAPIGVTATQLSPCDSINVSWIPRIGADSYRVYRNTVDNSTGSLVVGADLDLPQFSDANIVPGIDYFYWVEAINLCSTGVVVVGDSAQGMAGGLAAPIGMGASDDNCAYVEVTWELVQNADSYSIHRNTTEDPGGAAEIGTVPSPPYQDETVDQKTQYYFWVTSNTNSCTGTDFGASDSGWAVPEIATTTGVAATTGQHCDYIGVTWDEVEFASQFEIFSAVTNDETASVSLGTTTGNLFNHTTTDPVLPAVAGTTYYYWIKTTNNCGEGDFSEGSNGWLAETLTPPAAVTQTQADCDSVTLTWSAVAGADNYSLWRSLDNDTSHASVIYFGEEVSVDDSTVAAGQTYTYWVTVDNDCGSTLITDPDTPTTEASSDTPPNPTNMLATTDQCGSVTISWDSVDNVDGYDIWVSTSSTDPDNQAVYLDTVTAEEFIQEGAIPDVPLYYWVRSVRNDCRAGWGVFAEGYALAPMAVPQGLSATADAHCEEIWLDWDDTTVATTFHIFRAATNDSGTAVEIAETGNSAYVDNSVAVSGGGDFYYWLKGENSCGTSPFSESALGWSQVAPTAPSDVQATESGNQTYCDSVYVNWMPTTNADSYVVYRSKNGDSGTALPLATVTEIGFEDPTASPGIEYTYWVTAVNDCGESNLATADSDTGAVGQLAPPPTITATQGTCTDSFGSVVVSWAAAVDGATGYRVYRSQTPDFAQATLLNTVDSLEFIDSSPPEYDVPLYYFVESVNAVCTDPDIHSGAIAGIARTPITVPTGILASFGTVCDEVWVNWDAVTGNPVYRILRGTTDDVSAAAVIATGTLDVPYVDSGPGGGWVSGQSYYYWVESDNGCNVWSAASTSATGQPAEAVASPTVTASDGTECGQIDVSWPPVPTATQYAVYRSEQDASDTAKFQSYVTAANYADTTAAVGVTYFYWVRAENDCGISAFPVGGAGGEDGLSGDPVPPSSVTASDDNCAFVAVTWDTVAGATSYTVYRYTTDNPALATDMGSVASPPFHDETTDPKTQYYYWVTSSTVSCTGATFSASDSGWSVPELAIPTNVVATTGQFCDTIEVTWDTVSLVLQYEIFAGITNDETASVSLGTTTSTIFNHLTTDPVLPAVAGTTYYYWIKATNSCGEGGFSIGSSGWLAETLTPPAAVTQTEADCVSVTLTWSAVSGASNYSLWRSLDTDTTHASVIYSADATSHLDSTVDAGQAYNYWVTVGNDCGTTLITDPNTPTTEASSDTPANPTVVTATVDQCGSVTISWDSVDNVDGYQVWFGRVPDPTDPINPAVQLTTVTAEEYTDNIALPDIPLYYWVRSERNDCTAEWGFSAEGYALAPMEIPQGLGVTAGSHCGEIWLGWDAATVATTFHIFRAATNDSTAAVEIAETGNTTYVDDSVAVSGGADFYYWLKGENSCGTSPFGESELGWSQTAPAAPTSVDATDAGNQLYCDSVFVNWAPSINADAYVVHRSKNGNSGSAIALETVTDVGYVDATASPGIEYTYWVTAANDCGESTVATADSDTGEVGQLTPPTTITATQGTCADPFGEVTISWTTGVDGATGYHVYRADTPDFDQADWIGTADGLEFADASPSGYDVPLYYFVSSINEFCTTPDLHSGAVSGIAKTPITIPTGVEASFGTVCDEIWLDWDTGVGNAVYRLRRGTSGDVSASSIIATGLLQAPYMDTGPVGGWETGQVYYYWVESDNGCSVWSEPSTTATGRPAVDLASPAVTVTAGTLCGEIQLAWPTVATATQYAVYRAEQNNSLTAALQGYSTDPSFVDDSTEIGLTYYYWVRAENDCGISSFPSSGGGGEEGWSGDLGAPTTVRASDFEDCGFVAVQWNSVLNAMTYQVYRGTESTGDDAESIGHTSGTTYSDVNADAFVEYYYFVSAHGECGESAWSAPDVGMAKPPIVVPANVTATNHELCGQIQVTWEHPGDGAVYDVYRNTTSDTSTWTLVSNDQMTQSYLDSTDAVANAIVAEQTYYYWIIASNDCGNSDPTGAIVGAAVGDPETVEEVFASGSCVSITVQWTPVNNADSYTLLKSSSGNLGSASVAYEGGQTAFVDADVATGSSYTYWVRSANLCDESAVSSPTTEQTDGAATPENVSATDGTQNCGVTITWNAVPGATRYYVYRDVDTDPSDVSWFASTTGTTVVDENPNSYVWHYYVKAWNQSCGETEFSQGNTGYAGTGLGHPESVSASWGNCGSISVNWTAVSGASSYSVWRSTAPSGWTAQLRTTGVTGLAYTDTAVTTDILYYYWVTAEASGSDACENDFGPATSGYADDCAVNGTPDGGKPVDGPATSGDGSTDSIGSDPPSGDTTPPPADDDAAEETSGDDVADSTEDDDVLIDWSICLVGDTNARQAGAMANGDERWVLPIGSSVIVSGSTGQVEVFFRDKGGWNWLRTLHRDEVLDGTAALLLQGGRTTIVGEQGDRPLLMTGISTDDCDRNGIADGCEVLLGLSIDSDRDGMLDVCEADLNQDGIVDVIDFIVAIDSYGCRGDDLAGDLDGDGVVGPADLIGVLGHLAPPAFGVH